MKCSLASNSWMHTPQGHEIVDGRVIPVDWLAVIFNPSFPYRLTHMVIAAFLATAFFVGASAAWHLLRGRNSPEIRTMLSMAMWMALIVAPIQAVVGDYHGLNTLEYQPAKIAAIEGNWESTPGEPSGLALVGWPDMQREETRFKVEVPYLGSLILRHSLSEPIPTFRLMVALGVLMIVAGVWSLVLRRRGRLYESRPFLRFVLWMGPSGLLAILAGWFTTEVGRQPWVVQGLLRTADAVSPHGVAQMSLSLILFVIIYCAVFGVGALYVLRLVARGPISESGRQAEEGGPGRPRTPSRPISAADQALPGGRDQLGERS